MSIRPGKFRHGAVCLKHGPLSKLSVWDGRSRGSPTEPEIAKLLATAPRSRNKSVCTGGFRFTALLGNFLSHRSLQEASPVEIPFIRLNSVTSDSFRR